MFIKIFNFTKLNIVSNQTFLLKETICTRNRNYLLGNVFEFIQQDMIIRIESLKIELEKIEINLFEKIFRTRANLAKKCRKSFKSIRISKNDQLDNNCKLKFIRKVETFTKNANYLNKKLNCECINVRSSDNKNSINNLDLSTEIKSFQDLIRLIKNIRNSNFSNELNAEGNTIVTVLRKPKRVDISSNNIVASLITKSLIGYLNCKTSPVFLEKRLLTANSSISVKVLNLAGYLKSACGLAEILNSKQKYELIITDFATDAVKYFKRYEPHLVDETEMTKSVTRFNNFKLKKLYAICTDFEFDENQSMSKNDNLYICDMELQRVLIFDFTMIKLKRILNGAKSKVKSEEDEFSCPRDICYFNQMIYVLDQGKKLVNIFSKQGDFVRDFDYNTQSEFSIENAWSVRVNSNAIAIIDWKEKVCLFDFDFNLRTILRYPEVTSMCLLNDCFFQKNTEPHLKLFLHSEKGDLIVYKVFNDSKQTKEPVLIFKNNYVSLKYRSEFMIYASTHKVILTLGWSKSIAIVEF